MVYNDPQTSPWEKQPCLFPSMQFPIMAKLGTKSLAHTSGASDLISMYSVECI